MTCKGCENRKGKIRKWLGVESVLRLAVSAMRRYTDSRIRNVLDAGSELEKRVDALELEIRYLRGLEARK